jgi:hypothetical protein
LAIEPKTAPVVAVIGFAWLLGGAVLAWLSSPATLTFERDNEDRVTATLESRLFGMFVSRSERIERVRMVWLVRDGVPGQMANTPFRMVFETPKGRVDLGRSQQLFTADYPGLVAFFRATTPPSATWSSIGRGAERRRFYVAQAIAAFLCLVGFGLVASVISGLLARRRSARA